MSNEKNESNDWFAEALGSCGEVVSLVDVEVNSELMRWHGIPVEVFGRVRIHEGNLRLVKDSIAELGGSKFHGHAPENKDEEK